MIFNDEVVTYCVFTCYLSHYYTIAWDRLSNQFFCLCMCVCMYVCMYVSVCGRPPSWISILGHNFGVDQHFCAKFTRKWKIGSPMGPSAQKSDFRKSKMADGRHLGFRFWATISASINIFACFLC